MLGASNEGFVAWTEQKRNPRRILVEEARRNVYLRITLIWIQTEDVDCIHVDQDRTSGGRLRKRHMYVCVCIYIYIYIYIYIR